VFGALPATQAGTRLVAYAIHETMATGMVWSTPVTSAIETLARRHLHKQVPDPWLRRQLTPDFRAGCKRILFSNNWFQALQQPNVDVLATGVREVRGNVVVGADGSEAEVDAIILGTGFHILDMPVADHVRGLDGETLAERWAGSPEAYLGTVVPGFPNAFILLGPSLGTGHTSAFQIVEAVTAYIVKAIGHARSADVVLDVRADVLREYVDGVQAGLEGTAYNRSECNSYYRDANGRNSFAWPWSSGALARRVSRFDPTVYVTTPVSEEISA
jgi:cation diffusion facilitator CzcD-associated flavoprotein CzcO